MSNLYDSFVRLQEMESPYQTAHRNAQELMGPIDFYGNLLADGTRYMADRGIAYANEYMHPDRHAPEWYDWYR